jgi:hypothetical protein
VCPVVAHRCEHPGANKKKNRSRGKGYCNRPFHVGCAAYTGLEHRTLLRMLTMLPVARLPLLISSHRICRKWLCFVSSHRGSQGVCTRTVAFCHMCVIELCDFVFFCEQTPTRLRPTADSFWRFASCPISRCLSRNPFAPAAALSARLLEVTLDI